MFSTNNSKPLKQILKQWFTAIKFYKIGWQGWTFWAMTLDRKLIVYFKYLPNNLSSHPVEVNGKQTILKQRFTSRTDHSKHFYTTATFTHSHTHSCSAFLYIQRFLYIHSHSHMGATPKSKLPSAFNSQVNGTFKIIYHRKPEVNNQ